jgi:translation initiation factor 2B subunit (eIF-2B alpha/beta/delta family)
MRREDASLLPAVIEQGIKQIRSNNRSGATELARRAADVLAEVASASPFHEILEQTCRRLVAAQPSMAPMVNLANRALWDAVSPASLKSICRDFATAIENAGARIAGHTLALIDEGSTVLTYSSSRTVRDAIVAAHESGLDFDVACTESRPMCEGTALARDLGAAGITVTLAADGALLDLARRADVALVGADALTDQGAMNKRGTALLVLAGRDLGLRTYVLADTRKIVPAGYELPVESPKPAEEITAEPLPGVTVDNRYFDLTPLEWIAGLVCEDGLFPPWKVRELARREEVHPVLRDIHSRA